MDADLPLVQVVTPGGVEGDVVLHRLVSEEQALVPPPAGGEGRAQHQVSYVSLGSSKLGRSREGEHLVESRPRGNRHQVRCERLDVLVRKTQTCRGDEVQRKREDWRGTLRSALIESEVSKWKIKFVRVLHIQVTSFY